jgi:chromosome partitioning protein
MKTIAIAAQKGGVGKTTTAVYVAVALARRGVSVLVVDLDPQANATALLAPQAAVTDGTADVLVKGVALEDVTLSTDAGVDLCGAEKALGFAELALANLDGRELRLRTALDEVTRDRWDLCILDCPPSLGGGCRAVSLRAVVSRAARSSSTEGHDRQGAAPPQPQAGAAGLPAVFRR